MPRYVVVNRRGTGGAGRPAEASAFDAVSSEPGVTVVSAANPRTVTIDAAANVADRLRKKLAKTHFVEPEIRRGLE